MGWTLWNHEPKSSKPSSIHCVHWCTWPQPGKGLCHTLSFLITKCEVIRKHVISLAVALSFSLCWDLPSLGDSQFSPLPRKSLKNAWELPISFLQTLWPELQGSPWKAWAYVVCCRVWPLQTCPFSFLLLTFNCDFFRIYGPFHHCLFFSLHHPYSTFGVIILKQNLTLSPPKLG